MNLCKEIPPELEDENLNGCDFHPQSCLTVIVICIVFWALIFAVCTCSGQSVNFAIHYNADGRTTAKLAYQSPSWGAYITTSPDVTWVVGKYTEDCFDTRSAFTFGVSRSVNEMITLSAGVGKSKNEHHCADNSWTTTSRFTMEASAGFKIVQGRLLSLGLDAGMIYGFEFMIFSGINIGIKIK